MIMILDDAINNPLECEEFQLKNWLSLLSKYIERDTPMTVENTSLSGKRECPSCKKLMALGVKNFCDRCGQNITTEYEED